MLWRNPNTSAGPGASRTSILPKLRPQVPSAGHFGGDSWLKLHEAHVNTVQTNQGPADVLLVGDKAQNVLWRLDHGGVEGLQPKAIAALDPLKLDSDPKVKVLDLWPDFTNADGTITKDLFTPDNSSQSSSRSSSRWDSGNRMRHSTRRSVTWDMYRRADVPMPKNPDWPTDAPRVAWHNGREIRGDAQRPLTPEAIREIRHGYLANITFMDAQIGKVLDELDRQQLTDSTVIVFCSDHGFHLGEHTLWAKISNFKLDARVPLLIATPKMKSAGKTIARELYDLRANIQRGGATPWTNSNDSKRMGANE